MRQTGRDHDGKRRRGRELDGRARRRRGGLVCRHDDEAARREAAQRGKHVGRLGNRAQLGAFVRDVEEGCSLAAAGQSGTGVGPGVGEVVHARQATRG
ncbi:hypothetical protein C3E79_02725 [Corynebacterium liangguodongii]|uniref:Uncharacterized protein n=1 Tax=Corynebacterium liangguodongii TaxID=2079535 RepID=A0A2S0WCN8_9CORY|nr:hypothetical protein C3E79_02725 [Corynebacterium liangguodongii]PWC00371.1 hypothetical protein DF219_00230 [Corynebacterium liangguodongii]